MSCGGWNRGANLIPVFENGNVQQKATVVIAGSGIGVEDLSDADTYRFRVSTTEVDSLSVNLTLTAKESSVTKANPVLKGTVIDEIILSWSYNKAIATQELTNDAGLAEPSLNDNDTSYSYTGQSLDENSEFTIEGNDGLNSPGSAASDSKSITFGNNMYLGDNLDSKAGALVTSLQAMLNGFTKVVKTSRTHSFYATGGDNEYHYVAYPASYGLASFTKQGLPGGYVRLKNVGGYLKRTLLDGDVELPINIENEKGHSEAYYVYESYSPGIGDAVNLIYLT